MKKKQKIVFKHILIAVLSILAILSMGVGCYIGVVKFWGIDIIDDGSSVETKTIVSSISIDKKQCNLIYSVDRNDNKIDVMMLEFFNSNSGKIDYVTIPANLKMSLSRKLIEKIQSYGYRVEDTISLKKIIEIFGKEDAFQFGELILEDGLGLNISYYTVFDEKIFAKYFVQNEKEFYIKIGSKYTKYEYELLEMSESYKTKCKELEYDVSVLMEQGYKDLESNFTLNNKKHYIDGYEDSEIEKIYYWHLIGKDKYNQFMMDKQLSNKLFTYILGTNKQYGVTQEEWNEKCRLSNVSK